MSEIITEFTVLIAQATEEFRPDADEAKQMTRGRLALVGLFEFSRDVVTGW